MTINNNHYGFWFIFIKKSIIFVCILDKEDLVQLLLENGANVNVGDDEERTPLIYAIKNSLWKKLIEILHWMLKKHLNSFDLFYISDNENIASALIAKGVNFDATMMEFKPIHLAVYYGKTRTNFEIKYMKKMTSILNHFFSAQIGKNYWKCSLKTEPTSTHRLIEKYHHFMLPHSKFRN